MAAGRKGKTISSAVHLLPRQSSCNANKLLFTSAAVTGLAPGIDDLARETETEAEGAVTARGAAPETDHVQGDSDLPNMTNCPSHVSLRLL